MAKAKLDANWTPVAVNSRPLKAAVSAAEKLQAEADAAWAKAHAIKTAELRQAGELSGDEEPIYGHGYGRWTIAMSKADDSVIGRAAPGTSKARRSAV